MVAAWRPVWRLVGAWVFGAPMYLSLAAQSLGLPIPSPRLAALPQAGAIVVLVPSSRDRRRIRLHRPGQLGQAFREAT